MNTQKKTILLVEDEEITKLVQKRILEQNGFDVITVSTGEDAVKTVDSASGIDLVLMDIELGEGIDGTEAAATILEKHEIPLIFLSSHSAPDIVGKTGGVSSYGYILKESAETILLASINMAFRLFESQQRQKALEQQYRTLFENTGSGIIVIEEDTTISLANEEFSRTVGLSREEIEGKIKWPELIVTDDVNRMIRQHSIRREKPGKADSHYEFRFKNRAGEKRHILLRVSMIPGTKKSIASMFDISEHKKTEKEKRDLEERLFHAHKMEAIGTLAGGIAHNFNNILMGISGYNSLLMNSMEPSQSEFEYLRGIDECIKDAKDLTGNLLGFARGGKYEIKPTDINNLLKRETFLFGRTRKEITIHENYEKNIHIVKVDQGQISQVILNLFINAWQAMPEGGNIYVHTENIDLSEDPAPALNADPGKYVKINITDTGHGMDRATRENIFTPFFSSKKPDKGFGLGLASVYGIINNHGGSITVHSKEGKGTTFTILLPASERETPYVRDTEVSQKPVMGEGTILLVDDEELILKIGEKILTHLGYTALTASGGSEAVEIYEKNRNSIRMVVLDMTMPGMSGGETYDRLREIDPEVAVLLASGYSVDHQAQEILNRGCRGFIQKPFSMEDLSFKISEILNG